MPEFYSGRRIPNEGRSRAANDKPHRPEIKSAKLRDLSKFLPDGKNGILFSKDLNKGATTDHGNGNRTKGTHVTPVYRLPLTPFFVVSHGGGRVYGGGTSTEALRRARKKLRKR